MSWPGFSKNLNNFLKVGNWDYTPCGCFLSELSDGSLYLVYDTSTVHCKVGDIIRSTKLVRGGEVVIRRAYLCVAQWAQPNHLMLPLCYKPIIVAMQ